MKVVVENPFYLDKVTNLVNFMKQIILLVDYLSRLIVAINDTDLLFSEEAARIFSSCVIMKIIDHAITINDSDTLAFSLGAI